MDPLQELEQIAQTAAGTIRQADSLKSLEEQAVASRLRHSHRRPRLFGGVPASVAGRLATGRASIT